MLEETKEKNITQAEKEDKMLDYALKFSVGSMIFGTLICLALTSYMVFLIVNK